MSEPGERAHHLIAPVVAVAAVVLAAGASTRLGRPKQLLPFRGTTLLRWVVEQALASAASPVCVVLGAHAGAIEPTLDGLAVERIHNAEWREGQGASVRAAMRRLGDRERAPDRKPSAVLFLLADQPLVTPAAIDRLIAAHRETGARLVASDRDGLLGVPALFAAAFFAELAQLHGDAGARHLLRAHAAEAVGIALPGTEVDVDTAADYARLAAMGS